MPWSSPGRLQRLLPGRRSLRIRITTLTVLLGLVAVGAASAASLAVLVKASDDSAQRVLVDRLATLQTRVTLRSGQIAVAEGNDAVFDTSTWIYDRSGTLVDGTAAPADLAGALQALSGSRTPDEETVGLYRLRSEPLLGGEAVAVVALDLRPYLSSLKKAIAVNLGLGLLSTAALAAVAYAASRQVLRPVMRMARTAQNWDRQRLADRFGLGPPTDELSELGAVLDRLLDRVATTIADEERLTAELAHELRTPLTVIDAEAQLALRDPASAPERLARIRDASAQMTTTMHVLLDVARSTVQPAESDVDQVVRTALQARRVAAPIVARHTAAPSPVLTAVPEVLLERMLAPLLENAFRYARTRVEVVVSQVGPRARVDVRNDGPPIEPELRNSLFQPGVRSATSDGAGLGLALALRLVGSVQGSLQLLDVETTTFRIDLPSTS